MSTLTHSELSEITGLSTRRHQQLAADGNLPRPNFGVWDTRKTLEAFIRYQREQMARKNDGLKVFQRQLTKAKAETAEFILSDMRGENVKRSEIGPALRNLGANMRSCLLRKYEQEMAPKLAGRTTLEILKEIQDTNDVVIGIFHDSTRKWLNAPPPSETTPTPRR